MHSAIFTEHVFFDFIVWNDGNHCQRYYRLVPNTGDQAAICQYMYQHRSFLVQPAFCLQREYLVVFIAILIRRSIYSFAFLDFRICDKNMIYEAPPPPEQAKTTLSVLNLKKLFPIFEVQMKSFPYIYMFLSFKVTLNNPGKITVTTVTVMLLSCFE